jgi:restriction endonuclease Mrr
MNNQISLETYRTKGAKIFTGRDRGEYVREKSNIDRIENENEEVIIVIPDNLYSINPSFFEELFVNVVTKLGKENFYEKFNFKNDGTYNYEKPLKEAVARILREKTALD